MLQLRVYGDEQLMASVASLLSELPGARHVTLSANAGGGSSVIADIRTDVADRAFEILDGLGVAADDVVFSRLDTIGTISEGEESLALVWADVLSQARTRARAPGRYFVLMAAAGVVAAFAVINASPVLIVGAMAISPDLLPITAACTGLVLRNGRLVLGGIGSLAAGLAVTGAVAATITALLDTTNLLPGGFTLGAIPAAQTHVGTSTILVALAAGVAGMLAVETRASSAVGVAISVTTVPAVGYLGVAIAIGDGDKGLSALWVLGANVAMMLLGGACALALQRVLRPRLAT
jgi:uncharacterized hydrophobic protein (TIGR00271 family)